MSGAHGVGLEVLLDRAEQVGRYAAVGLLADHLSVPEALPQDDTRHDQRGVIIAVVGEIEGAQVLRVAAVDSRHDVATGIGNHAKALTAVGADREVQRRDLAVGLEQTREVDEDRFVVAVALAGEVVAGVPHRLTCALQLPERDGEELVPLLVHGGAVGVEVDTADALGRVPAEPHADPLEAAAVVFEEADDLALFQAGL